MFSREIVVNGLSFSIGTSSYGTKGWGSTVDFATNQLAPAGLKAYEATERLEAALNQLPPETVAALHAALMDFATHCTASGVDERYPYPELALKLTSDAVEPFIAEIDSDFWGPSLTLGAVLPKVGPRSDQE